MKEVPVDGSEVHFTLRKSREFRRKVKGIACHGVVFPVSIGIPAEKVFD